MFQILFYAEYFFYFAAKELLNNFNQVYSKFPLLNKKNKREHVKACESTQLVNMKCLPHVLFGFYFLK